MLNSILLDVDRLSGLTGVEGVVEDADGDDGTEEVGDGIEE